MRTVHPFPSVRAVGLPTLALLGLVPTLAAAPEPPAVAARCVSAEMLLLRRAAEGQPWQVVAEKDDLRAGELSVTSTYPVRETAVVLHDSKDVDLDLTLDRGRIDLVNRLDKKSRPVRVRVRIRNR